MHVAALLPQTVGAMHGLPDRVSAMTTNFATASEEAKRCRAFAAASGAGKTSSIQT